MAGAFRSLVYCNRYQRILHIPRCQCGRVQLWHRMQRPYGIFRASSILNGSTERAKEVTSTFRKPDNYLLPSVYFQRPHTSRLKYGWLNVGPCHLQFIHHYSTKKNVVASQHEKEVTKGERTAVAISEKSSNTSDCKRKDSNQVILESRGTEVPSPSEITSDASLTEVSTITIDNKIGNKKIQSKLQRYALWRFTLYLKRFQKSLENEMPDTFNMFRIFSIGLKDFVVDFKDFMKVLIILSMPGTTLRSLSRRDIELYYNMPGDMFRVFPILVISSVPFGQNVAFPIGYWFPKQLLCHHFWDIQQRHDFAVMALKKRLFNARPVFRSMQNALLTIENIDARNRCQAVFYKLGSGIHPTIEEVVSLLPLFQSHPFHIKSIRITHANGLLRLHGKSVWLRSRTRLQDHARMLHYLDTAISREGLDTLTFDQLKSSLFLRGVNPTNMSTKSMKDFLETWLSVSREVDASSYSLLLHLPILIAYNQPSNFSLIY